MILLHTGNTVLFVILNCNTLVYTADAWSQLDKFTARHLIIYFDFPEFPNFNEYAIHSNF